MKKYESRCAKHIVKENLTSGFFMYRISLKIGDNSVSLKRNSLINKKSFIHVSYKRLSHFLTSNVSDDRRSSEF